MVRLKKDGTPYKKRRKRTARQKKETRAIKRDKATRYLYDQRKRPTTRLAEELRGAMDISKHPGDLKWLRKVGKYRKSAYRYQKMGPMKRGGGSLSGSSLLSLLEE